MYQVETKLNLIFDKLAEIIVMYLFVEAEFNGIRLNKLAQSKPTGQLIQL